jgi:hypothetical protein
MFCFSAGEQAQIQEGCDCKCALGLGLPVAKTESTFFESAGLQVPESLAAPATNTNGNGGKEAWEEDMGATAQVQDSFASSGALQFADILDGARQALQALNDDAVQAQGQVAALLAAGPGQGGKKKSRHEQITSNPRHDLHTLGLLNTKGYIQDKMAISAGAGTDSRRSPSLSTEQQKRPRLGTLGASGMREAGVSPPVVVDVVGETATQQAALLRLVNLWNPSLAEGTAPISSASLVSPLSLWQRIAHLGPNRVEKGGRGSHACAGEKSQPEIPEIGNPSKSDVKSNSNSNTDSVTSTSTPTSTSHKLKGAGKKSKVKAGAVMGKRPGVADVGGDGVEGNAKGTEDGGDLFSVLLISRSSQATFQSGGGMGPGAGWDVVTERTHGALLWKCLVADHRQVRVGGVECARQIAELCAATSGGTLRNDSDRLRNSGNTKPLGGLASGSSRYQRQSCDVHEHLRWEHQQAAWQQRDRWMRGFQQFQRRPLHFPQDFPDTPASVSWWKTWSREHAAAMSRQPPSKRLRGIQSWKAPRWDLLFGCGNGSNGVGVGQDGGESEGNTTVDLEKGAVGATAASNTDAGAPTAPAPLFNVTVIRNAAYAQPFLLDAGNDNDSDTDGAGDGENLEAASESEAEFEDGKCPPPGKRVSHFVYVPKKRPQAPSPSQAPFDSLALASAAALDTKFPTLVSVVVVLVRRGVPATGASIFMPTAQDYRDWRTGRHSWKMTRYVCLSVFESILQKIFLHSTSSIAHSPHVPPPPLYSPPPSLTATVLVMGGRAIAPGMLSELVGQGTGEV